MSHPIYAIGDVHGQMGQLDRVLHLIETDGGKDAHIVFLGDYTDRGPDSAAVLDTLVDAQAQGRNWTFLKGNHDRMFEWFMEVPPRSDPYMMVSLYWLHERLGGDTTLASYGVDVRPDRREKDVHAEALAAVPLHHQDEEDLLWIRQEFHNHRGPHPKLIVHGHTPVREATHYGNRVNLDSAAGDGEPLTAAVFEGDRVWRLSAQGRVPMEPAYA